MGAYRVTTNGKSILTTKKPADDPKITIGGVEVTDPAVIAAIMAVHAQNSDTTVEEVAWKDAVQEAAEYVRSTKPIIANMETVRKEGSIALLKEGMKPEAVKALAQTSYATILNWIEPTIDKKKTLIVDAKIKKAILAAKSASESTTESSKSD